MSMETLDLNRAEPFPDVLQSRAVALDPPSEPTFYRAVGKSLFDLLFVLLAAPVALPLIAVAAAVLMCRGGAPFYWQERVGYGGRVFWMLKLRTMVVDAEAQLAAHLRDHPEARREWNEKQKLCPDPRVTRFGHFLRKSSMDELPQLWNVLRGDMSIVGPRPMMVGQMSLYPDTAYYAMRPGITGPWQVTDRNESSFAARARFDRDYLHALSFATDLKILVRTVAVVLRGTGC